ncbi:uncharacterized protein LOC127794809 [Diospyros lotus]|uniref:uncharacterized protein LOC127794809 n=1 Tax=Diospyros lotus TaxID=55363 RepID=UPI00224CCD7A|nr:uncharacterized protein LOC127794809 [Diospyros lotus]
MEFLVKKVEIELKGKNIQKPANLLNTINECRYTTLDILEEIKADVPEFNNDKEMFRKANALKASEVNQAEWLSKKRDALMVVASLIATMAFQAGVSPPGGFWQENSTDHRGGEAVMAFNYPDSYPLFLHANTIEFVALVSTILFLLTGWPFKKFLMWILVLIMWLTITSMAFTYAFSLLNYCDHPEKRQGTSQRHRFYSNDAWCSVMALLLVAHTIRLLNQWLKINQEIDV